MKRMLVAGLCALFLVLDCPGAFAQNASGITSTYPVGAVTVNKTILRPLITVSYPTNLDPHAYLALEQLQAAMQFYLSTYPTEDAPPFEAVFSSAVSSLLRDYPQITTANITATYQLPISIGGTVTISVSIVNAPAAAPVDPGTQRVKPQQR